MDDHQFAIALSAVKDMNHLITGAVIGSVFTVQRLYAQMDKPAANWFNSGLVISDDPFIISGSALGFQPDVISISLE